MNERWTIRTSKDGGLEVDGPPLRPDQVIEVLDVDEYTYRLGFYEHAADVLREERNRLLDHIEERMRGHARRVAEDSQHIDDLEKFILLRGNSQWKI